MSARIWQARIRSQIDILPSGAKARLRQCINDIDRLEPAQETGRPDCSGLLETFCRIADSGGPSAPGKWQEAQRELALVLHHLADHCDIPPTLKQIAYDGASGKATLAAAQKEVNFLKAALAGKRSRKVNPRDKYCYERSKKGDSLKTIMAAVNAHKGWEPLATLQGVSQAAKRHAQAQGLPWPIR